MVRKDYRDSEKGNSLGGIIEVIAAGLPIGLRGSHTEWDLRLDGRACRVH